MENTSHLVKLTAPALSDVVDLELVRRRLILRRDKLNDQISSIELQLNMLFNSGDK